MNERTRIGAAVVGGYLLGRTKKGGTAVRLAMWLNGTSTGSLARDGLRRVASSPEINKLLSQGAQPLLEAARGAALSAVEARLSGLADGLNRRTSVLIPSAGAEQTDQAAEEDHAAEEDDEPQETEEREGEQDRAPDQDDEDSGEAEAESQEPAETAARGHDDSDADDSDADDSDMRASESGDSESPDSKTKESSGTRQGPRTDRSRGAGARRPVARSSQTGSTREREKATS